MLDFGAPTTVSVPTTSIEVRTTDPGVSWGALTILPDRSAALNGTVVGLLPMYAVSSPCLLLCIYYT